jgi:hypothetical protein
VSLGTRIIMILWSPAGEIALGSTVKCCLSLTGGAYFADKTLFLRLGVIVEL